MTDKTLWQCPKCGRQFKNKNQWHSCISYSINDHFKDKQPSLKETFDFLISKIKEFGSVRVDAVKTGINIATKSHFAMVFVHKNSLNLELRLNRNVESDRILHTHKFDNNYLHTVKLKDTKDIDKNLLGWLKEAYNLRK